MFDLTRPNNLGKEGFVAFIQPAPLGNALSTMANAFEFTQRTGIASIYPGLSATPATAICANAEDAKFIVNGETSGLKVEAIVDLTHELCAWVGGGGAISNLSANIRQPSELAGLETVANSIIVMAARQEFQHLSFFELGLSDLARRGNGIFMTGAYWPQYLAEDDVDLSGLRDKLKLSQDHSKRGERSFIEENLNVGIHMRRGADYRLWFGGRYFFSLESYIQTIMAISRDFPAATFHIFTNEAFSQNDFPSDLNIVVCPGATDVADFLNMGRCDFVAGPPSTFATWAAYLGNSRRLILTPERIADLSNGSHCSTMISDVLRPTFSYAPGVNGPL